MLFNFLRPDPLLLDQVEHIRAFRNTVRLVQDKPSRTFTRRLKAAGSMLWKVLKAVAHIRYAFAPVRQHDWILAYDGKRIRPAEGESGHGFLTRVCKTNRPQPLPELIGLNANERLVLVDIAQLFGKTANSFGTLAFLLSLAGPIGILRLAWQIMIGLLATRSPGAALFYGALDMVRHRSILTQRGIWMTTTTTWLAEILRVGLSAARSDFEIVEVLHGATTKNTQPYFQWLHEQALATPLYVNLIAGLPRFYPQSTHLLTDAEGEIACNIRLWQGIKGDTLTVSREKLRLAGIAVIGGASTDTDYSTSSYFLKEKQLVRALRDRLTNPILYCVHPKHDAVQQKRLLGQIEGLGVTLATKSTQSETLEARVVVGGLSTSLIEAALLGRPAFAYEDFGTLFIPEIACLVQYNSNIDVLADQVAQTMNGIGDVTEREDFELVSKLVKERYGLQLQLV